MSSAPTATPASRLDEWIEFIKKLSVLGGIATGLGLLMLYFFGIAIFSSFASAYGVPPFDFNLQNCLEYGSAYFGQILVASPYLILRGIADYFAEAPAGLHVLFGLPIALVATVHYLQRQAVPRAPRLTRVLAMVALLYLTLYMIIINFALLSALGIQNLMVDPAVNLALKFRAELVAGAAPAQYGIHHWDGWTTNTVVRDAEWKVVKVGTLFAVGLTSIVLGLAALRVFARTLANAPASGIARGVLVFAQRAFYLTFALFVVGFLFVTPGRTYILISSTSMPKVDVDIPSRADIAAKYYFIQVAEYEHGYAFYIPNLQQVVKVPKDKVNSILYKGSVDIFSDRQLFRKGPWLGVQGDWHAGDAAHTPTNPPGFIAKSIFPDSPGHKAAIMPGDVLIEFNGTRLDSRERLFELVERHGLKPADVGLHRDGRLLRVQVLLENQP